MIWRWVPCVLLGVGGLAVVAGAFQPQADPVKARAEAIHAKALTLDSHVDIAMRAGDYGVLTPGQKCDLVKMRRGGMKGVFLAAYVGQRQAFDEAAYKTAFEAAARQLDFLHALTGRQHPDLCALATSPDEVDRIAATGKRVVMTGLENGYPVGADVGNVKVFFDRGARYITLTHSGHNQIGDSSSDRNPPPHDGLSPFGERVVAEMNRLGLMVDVSHAAASTFWDVIRLSTAPIIASHSGCKALNDVDRNLDDEQLRALAKNGGVIQIVALGSYLKADTPERAEALRRVREELGLGRGRGGGPGTASAAQAQTAEQRAEAEKRRELYYARMEAIDEQYPAADLTHFVDHIDHAVKVAGIDHVGVGTDFDGGGGIPGFNDHSEALNVTEALVRRGYSETDIVKIWGGNLMRVWRAVEREAARRQGAAR